MIEAQSLQEGLHACSTAFEWSLCAQFLIQARGFLILVAAIGGISIPISLWIITSRREKKQLTIQLINNLNSLRVVDRQERLYLYRRYEDGEEPVDPYNEGIHSLLFDTAIYLNYIEAACFEIDTGAVYWKSLHKAADATITGARDIVLARYVRLTGIDAKRHYPSLLAVTEKFDAKNKKIGRSGPQTAIPNLLSPGVGLPGRLAKDKVMQSGQRTICRYDFESEGNVVLLATGLVSTQEALEAIEPLMEMKRQELERLAKSASGTLAHAAEKADE